MFGCDLGGDAGYAGLILPACDIRYQKLQRGLQWRGKVTCSLPKAQENAATWESEESDKLQIKV